MAKAYILNQVPTGYGQAISQFVEMLVAAGWSYKASGDGLAAYNATGKVFIGTGAGATQWNNNRAWARIAAPDARRELVVQHGANSGWRLKYSALAKFTGGTPNATTVPSATDERVLWGGGSDTTPTLTGYLSGQTPIGYARYQGYASDVAPYGFWWGSVQLPSGGVQHGLMMDPCLSVPEDPDPVVFHIGTTGAWTQGAFPSLGGTNMNAGSFPACGGAVQGSWGYMDVAMTVFGYVMPSMWAFGYWNPGGQGTASQHNIVGSGLPLNPFNEKHEALPLIWARIAGGGPANPGSKGWSTFMRLTTIPRTSSLDTIDGRKWVCMGQVWLPWDGVTAPYN